MALHASSRVHSSDHISLMALSLLVLASASLPLPRGSEASAPPFHDTHLHPNVSSCFMAARKRKVYGSAPPLLLSLPGSGNTFVRELLDAVSGLHSGSIYNDTTLVAKLPGESWPIDKRSGWVFCPKMSCIKAHAWSTDLLHHVCNGAIKSALVLLRHPLAAIWSDYQYAVGKAEVQQKSQHLVRFGGRRLNAHSQALDVLDLDAFATKANHLARQFVAMIMGTHGQPRPTKISWPDDVLYSPGMISAVDFATTPGMSAMAFRYEDLFSHTTAVVDEVLRFAGLQKAQPVKHSLACASTPETHRVRKVDAAEVMSLMGGNFTWKLWATLQSVASPLGYDKGRFALVTREPEASLRGLRIYHPHIEQAGSTYCSTSTGCF